MEDLTGYYRCNYLVLTDRRALIWHCKHLCWSFMFRFSSQRRKKCTLREPLPLQQDEMNCKLEMSSPLQSHGWSLCDRLRAGCGVVAAALGEMNPPCNSSWSQSIFSKHQPHLGCSRLLWRVWWRIWPCSFNSALLNWVSPCDGVGLWMCAAVCFWASQEQVPLCFCSLGPNIANWF